LVIWNLEIKLGKIEVFYRESFSGECAHIGTEKYDDGEIEMKDGGMWIYWVRCKDHMVMATFYPNVSIIRVNIEKG
jgi:hypothetical protein